MECIGTEANGGLATYGEWWYDIAMFYFDGHELTDKEREAL